MVVAPAADPTSQRSRECSPCRRHSPWLFRQNPRGSNNAELAAIEIGNNHIKSLNQLLDTRPLPAGAPARPLKVGAAARSDRILHDKLGPSHHTNGSAAAVSKTSTESRTQLRGVDVVPGAPRVARKRTPTVHVGPTLRKGSGLPKTTRQVEPVLDRDPLRGEAILCGQNSKAGISVATDLQQCVGHGAGGLALRREGTAEPSHQQ